MEEPTAKTRQRRVSQPTYGTNSSEYPHGRQRRRSAAAPLRRRTTVRRPRQKISSSSSGSTPEQEEVIEEHDFTLKDKQEAMNREHPFGLPIWKPALYRKSRSVVRKANLALHSSPSSRWFLSIGNVMWTLVFGWWLAIVMGILSIIINIMPPDGGKYSKMLAGLAVYLLWPFGRYVERVMSDSYQPVSTSAEEETGLLRPTRKRRSWKTTIVHIATSGPTGYLYYIFYFTIIAPLLFLVAIICWMCVVTIPMSKLTFQLLRHLRRRPLRLRFPSPNNTSSSNGVSNRTILLCTYEAVGLQYYKYTYEGINIIFINFLSLVFFVILDNFLLKKLWPDSFLASPLFLFTLSLGSVIPLSYFIGMAVSSVSAQTSMAVGSVINATFGSIIEIILYAIALMSSKGPLVEGSIIGSILVGVLLLPGSAMVSGGMKRKEQKFNSKSAGVTSTMLIMAIIAAMSPTFFYQMFASFELQCRQCPDGDSVDFSCSECHYSQMDPARDPVYQDNVKPFTWICAVILPSAYVIGMLFSLHTHAEMVWNSTTSEQERRQDKRKTYYQKLIQSYFAPAQDQAEQQPEEEQDGPSVYNRSKSDPSINVASNVSNKHAKNGNVAPLPITEGLFDDEDEEEEEEEMSGHDAPEWGTVKSFVILFACTVLYSIIAEILVDEVDVIMKDIALDEKFLGLTLFALVPNITEFTNAIGFSIHGNIVLSLEIGSAYALQVCLLQIPAMVAFSLWNNWGHQELSSSTFRLIFPTWDMIAVIFAVFLLTYTYQEGKSNYFKGAILILSYLVLVAGFYFIPSSPAAAEAAQHSFVLGRQPSGGLL